MNNDKDLQKAYYILDKMKPGEIMELNKIDKIRRDIFILCVKQYIDSLKTVEFNTDYSKLKKINKWL
jgi:hypothetical protein